MTDERTIGKSSSNDAPDEIFRDSEEKYRLLTENMTDVIWQTTPDLIITYVTPSINKLLGYEPHEIVGTRLEPLLTATGKELVYERYPEIMRQLSERKEVGRQIFEVEQIRKDGTTVWTEVVTAPSLDRSGKVTGFQGVTRDVSKRKQDEEVLRASEERFRTMFENHSAVMLLVDPTNGDILNANRSAENFYGYSVSQLQSMNISEINTLPHDEIQIYRNLARREQLNYMIFPHRLASGEIRTVEVHSSPIEQDGKSILFSIIHDITERKQAEESLRQSEQNFRLLTENTLDLIWKTDLDLRLTYVNPASVRVIGYTPDELIGASLERYCSKDCLEKLSETLSLDISRGLRGTGITLEGIILNKNQEPVLVELVGGVIYGENGLPVALHGVARDITDRKRIEEELRSARDELETRVEERANDLMMANQKLLSEIAERQRAEQEIQESHRKLEVALDLAFQLRVQAEAASHAKSEFLTNMSHELRTPLTAVIGFSDLLTGQFFGKLNQKQLLYTKEISDAGQHLLTLINDILDLSKIESGKMDLKMSDFDLSQLLGKCLTMTKERSIRRSLTVELKVSQELCEVMVRADDVRIKQVVINLLSNAIKFTPPGGTIQLDAQTMGEDILVSVSDTGIGLKPEDHNRIFQAFEQLDSSSSRNAQGTGLGLALVRRLVELGGGRIWVESPGPGLGSTFRFTFPFIKVQEEVDSRAKPHSIAVTPQVHHVSSFQTTKPPKILIVEDSVSNMKLFLDLLNSRGYETVQAFSAEDAISKAESDKPSLILMDISLPGLDGLSATQSIKKDPATSNIPIVALTAHAMPDDETKAKEAGCDSYIAKPIDTRKFNETIERLLNPTGVTHDRVPLVGDGLTK